MRIEGANEWKQIEAENEMAIVKLYTTG